MIVDLLSIWSDLRIFILLHRFLGRSDLTSTGPPAVTKATHAVRVTLALPDGRNRRNGLPEGRLSPLRSVRL